MEVSFKQQGFRLTNDLDINNLEELLQPQQPELQETSIISTPIPERRTTHEVDNSAKYANLLPKKTRDKRSQIEVESIPLELKINFILFNLLSLTFYGGLKRTQNHGKGNLF